ncbi:linear amide C-N hydrolase [Vibrio sp. FNV 38]|nr:linear amide C-N hydrolase [Vibrio sp. FNV 38]
MKNVNKKLIATLLPLTLTALAGNAVACTTTAWNTEYGVLTSRTMDWLEPTSPVLETFYAGEKRMLNNTESYTVKNDFVAIMAYGGLVAEGVNKHKLHANALYYAPQSTVEGSAGSPAPNQLAFVEYLLSEFDSVADVVDNMADLTLQFQESDVLPVAPTLHYALADSSGDRLIIEHDSDGLKMYRGETHAVMTNQPSVAQHMENWGPNSELNFTTIDAYTDFGSKGRINAEDRYLHANYFLHQLEAPSSARNGMMKLASTLYNIPHDANNKEINGKMTGYATEFQVTIDVSHGDSVLQYKWGDTWAQHEWNMYDVLEKGEKISVALDQQTFDL